MSKMNPLSKYTKIEVVSTELSSNGVLKYKPNVAKDTHCGVCARSARDELMFNNPEFLLNGEAVVNVIQNCVENIENARDLFVQDVEQLLVAIKLATGEETYDVGAVCPKCETEGVFERDLQFLLDTVKVLEEETIFYMDSGLNVHFRPHTWGESNKFALKAFQVQQQIKSLEAQVDMTDDQKVQAISPLLTTIARLQVDSALCSVTYIETPDDERVSDRKVIQEWLESLTSTDYKQIMQYIEKSNEFGISHEMECECTCGHKWVMTGMQMDPSSFFVQRS